mmetsp:Transcript_36522/g.91944  ORF Transcript_36522/g.91944 Transcript_36522/m.91944 type:complete len:263 (+) Transcript_36522:2-790(+)
MHRCKNCGSDSQKKNSGVQLVVRNLPAMPLVALELALRLVKDRAALLEEIRGILDSLIDVVPNVSHVAGETGVEVRVLAELSDEALQPLEATADNSKLELSKGDLVEPLWHEAGCTDVGLTLEAAEACGIGLRDLDQLVRRQVQDLIHQEVCAPLSQPRMCRVQPLPEAKHPSISGANRVPNRATWPLFLLVMVWFGHREDRVEERRAGAENRDVPSMDLHGLRAIHGTYQAELLDGCKVVTAVAIELGVLLLDDIFDTQGV